MQNNDQVLINNVDATRTKESEKKRSSTITWKGSGKEGKGTITTQSHYLDHVPYAWNSRFEEAKGTNPEELIAAAHAACFTMKLSFLLGEIGFVADEIETTSVVTLKADKISHSHLVVRGFVPGLDKDQFEKSAALARDNCLVSKALHVAITMEAILEE